MSETMTITTGDVATIPAELLQGRKLVVGVDITEEGNALLTCKHCKGKTDKGCPPIQGQDDRGYVCETCQGDANRVKLEKQLADAGGPLEISGKAP